MIIDKKRKMDEQNVEFSFNATADAKYTLKCPGNFIKCIKDGEEKFFDEVNFDNSRIVDVLKALGFHLDKIND